MIDLSREHDRGDTRWHIGFARVGDGYELRLRLRGKLSPDLWSKGEHALFLSPGPGGLITLQGTPAPPPSPGVDDTVLDMRFPMERTQILLLALYPVVRLRFKSGGEEQMVIIAGDETQQALMDAARSAMSSSGV